MEARKLPARVSSPGQILSMELEARGWTQSDLAAIMDRPAQALSEIINAKKQVTPETALELAEALGTSAELWLNLESNYRLHQARKHGSNQGVISRRSRLNELAPVRELLNRGWIAPADNSIDALEAAVCGFLRIGSPLEAPQVAANFRNSQAFTPEQASKVSWLMRVQQLAERAPDMKPDIAGLAGNLSELLLLSTRPEDTLLVPALLQKYGVFLTVVPHLPRTYVDGAAFHLSEKPVIALSLRYRRIDNYWFTLLHELAHLILKHEDVYFDSLYGSEGCEQPSHPQETEANAWASDILIAPEPYEKFIRESRFTGPAIRVFAMSIGRHPGIVVGRLQNDGHIGYNQHRAMLQNVPAPSA